MSLLRIDKVTKRFKSGKRGVREHVALFEVELQVDAGEYVAVWGRPRSGRTTLLQIAAGVERPSEGAVCFDGVDLARRPMLGRLDGLAYVSTRFAPVIGDSVIEHVAAPLLDRAESVQSAQSEAYGTLRRVDALAYVELDPDELDHGALIRVAIARALVTRPRLLLVDEPTEELPPARDRDTTLDLLRSLAHRDGVSVLMTVAEAAELAGVDRALTIDHGELRGVTRPAGGKVIELRPARRESSA